MNDFSKFRKIDEFVEELLRSMTLSEKIGQMTQYGRAGEREIQALREGKIGSLLNVWGAKRVNDLQRIAVEESRLGIPLLIGDDVIHGFQTIFPIPLAETCSWDLTRIEEAARIAAIEAASSGINWIFAPMVDVARDPRWGRIAEGAGEDPFLGSEVARARVRGFHSPNEHEAPMTAACPKHFVGYGAAEGGRDYNTTNLSEQELHTAYFPPFQAALDEGAQTMMAAFNDILGEPASGNFYLLRNILKDQWGFHGFVVSDWESIEEMIPHGYAADRKEAALRALLAGVDMDMHSGVYQEHLASLVAEDPTLEERINESVRRILRVKAWLGLFENPYVDEADEHHFALRKEHQQIAREIAQRSIVLLKNEKILPLSKQTKHLAVIGPLAHDKTNPLGCWSGKGNPEDVITILEGIQNAASPDMMITFSQGCGIQDDDISRFGEAVELAKQADIVIFVAGESKEMSGENHNRAFLGLPGVQQQLFEQLKKTGTPIVVVLMNGRPLAIPELARDADAILEAWHLGSQSGGAIADVLFGIYNPSGKLPVSFPKTVGQIPLYYNHKNTGRPLFEKYVDMDDKPLYPFGYGLSYTTFRYTKLTLQKTHIRLDESLVVQVDVENIGNHAGEETVQVYYRDLVSQVTRPVKQLCGFTKIMLQPGEKQMVSFVIPVVRFGYYDRDCQFLIEPGDFSLWVGPNSAEGLATRFSIVHST